MYGKIFTSIYDGTLVEDWRALVTFEQMIVLCDADGTIDMTPHALSTRTGIPIEHIKAGIEVLENPDPYSRTEGEDGRRILRIDNHRPWGWVVINHEKYKGLKDADTIRAQTRERVQRHREAKKLKDKGNNLKQDVTPGNAKKRHIDIDINKDISKTTVSGKSPTPKIPVKKKKISVRPKDIVEVLEFLNLKTGKDFHLVEANTNFIKGRLREAPIEDIKSIIAMKCREWMGKEETRLWLRPKTLFNKTNFAQYQGELKKVKK